MESTFQTIRVHGAISTQVFFFCYFQVLVQVTNRIQFQTMPSSNQNGTIRYPARHFKFLQLRFDTKQPAQDNGYRQSHIGITVDSCVETGQISRIESLHRMRTKAFDLEEKATSTATRGEAVTGGLSAPLSARPGITTFFSKSASNGVNEALERKKYNSGITQHDHDGVSEWGFKIDDVNDQVGGSHMSVERLPTVEFTFVNEANTLPIHSQTLPERMKIVISSFWSFHLMLAPNL